MPGRTTDRTTDLADRRHARLRLGEHTGLVTEAQAAAFLAEVSLALRNGAAASLPLASMYQAVWRQVPSGRRAGETERDAQHRATILTNALIASGQAIETNVVADRVAIAHAAIVPALIALARRNADPSELALSSTARRALAFIADTERPTAGQVRVHLGVPPRTWPNSADDALAELQRCLLIDRGAAEVPETGAPYLARDGIPYRVFDRTHPALIAKARRLAIDDAAAQLVAAYLAGAVFAPRGKLAALFKRCVSRAELDAALDGLIARGQIAIGRVAGKAVVIATAAGAPAAPRGRKLAP